MAREYHRALIDETLTRSSHSRGTPTPAPPGGPPALVGGHLKRSVRLYPAYTTGTYSAEAKVVPLIVYARIQELGGTVRAHGKALHWTQGGKGYFAQSVTLRPTHKLEISNGKLRDAAIQELKGMVP